MPVALIRQLHRAEQNRFDRGKLSRLKHLAELWIVLELMLKMINPRPQIAHVLVSDLAV